MRRLRVTLPPAALQVEITGAYAIAAPHLGEQHGAGSPCRFFGKLLQLVLARSVVASPGCVPGGQCDQRTWLQCCLWLNRDQRRLARVGTTTEKLGCQCASERLELEAPIEEHI